VDRDLFDEDVKDFDAAFATKKTGRIQTFHQSGHKEGDRYVTCADTHKPLPVGGSFVYGGACGWPVVKDADIYVGLDGSMSFKGGSQYPWHPKDESGPVEFLFRIGDGQAPKDPQEFKAMINWLAEQLKSGKKIHVGCIGGHGRTGMVLAALVKVVDGIEDAITFVREHYCHKVVESKAQVDFLQQHFGIKPVAGSHSLRVNHVHGGAVPKGLLKSAQDVMVIDGMTERQKALYATVHKGSAQTAAPTPGGYRSLPQGPFEALPCASITSVWGKGAKVRHKSVKGVDKQVKPDTMKASHEGA
jgi:hypothetical protein